MGVWLVKVPLPLALSLIYLGSPMFSSFYCWPSSRSGERGDGEGKKGRKQEPCTNFGRDTNQFSFGTDNTPIKKVVD